jgi:hypothetical protein
MDRTRREEKRPSDRERMIIEAITGDRRIMLRQLDKDPALVRLGIESFVPYPWVEIPPQDLPTPGRGMDSIRMICPNHDQPVMSLYADTPSVSRKSLRPIVEFASSEYCWTDRTYHRICVGQCNECGTVYYSIKDIIHHDMKDVRH